MIFKRELAEKILRGEKTQTRRLIKPNEIHRIIEPFSGRIISVWTPKWERELPERLYTSTMIIEQGWRRKWEVGRSYTVCPGRGSRPLYWRCESDGRITSWVPDMQNYHEWKGIASHPYNGGWQPLRISITEICRERLRDMWDEDVIAEGVPEGRTYTADEPFGRLWNSINTKAGTRWEDDPEVWAISFELVAN